MRERMTLREKIEARIASRPGEDVFLPREFRDLGGEDQVLRVVRALVQEKRLVRLGYGVYGRAVVSRLSGDPVLFAQTDFKGRYARRLPNSGWRGNQPRQNSLITKAAQHRYLSTRWCA